MTLDKHNEAVLDGWTVLMFDVKQVNSGQALRWLQRFFEQRP